MIVQRFLQTEDFTAGFVEFGGNTYYTLERPWLNNSPNVSCIPHGIYEVVPYGWKEGHHTKFKRTYHIKNVIDRSYILMHAGNFVENSQGCILIGKGFNIDGGKAMVTHSRNAMDELREYIGENAFKIEIKDI